MAVRSHHPLFSLNKTFTLLARHFGQDHRAVWKIEFLGDRFDLSPILVHPLLVYELDLAELLLTNRAIHAARSIRNRRFRDAFHASAAVRSISDLRVPAALPSAFGSSYKLAFSAIASALDRCLPLTLAQEVSFATPVDAFADVSPKPRGKDLGSRASAMSRAYRSGFYPVVWAGPRTLLMVPSPLARAWDVSRQPLIEHIKDRNGRFIDGRPDPAVRWRLNSIFVDSGPDELINQIA